jgi:hypothetical protein
MKRHWSVRLLGVALALAFGIAMAGPEAHQCPVHDDHTAGATTPAHHDATSSRHEQPSQKHCTCPQACCPVGVGVAMPATSAKWVVAPSATHVFTLIYHEAALPGVPKHLLHSALAPPHTLA